ncbi:hypothetical protein [Specibacter sp. RAF43]|uniref:hypothetical protein n=1 Tax=Specibacter sp. RAF43 TaxID=3233057 RepID=UPI003F9E1384
MDVPAAENNNGRRVDARALRFAIIFPVLLCLGLVIGGLLLAGALPRGVELPTGGGPLPVPAFLAVAVALTLLLGIGVGTQGARTTLPRQLRRVLLGVGMALQLASATLFAAALLGQSVQGGAAVQRVDGYVALMGCGLAAAMGVVLALTFKPDEQWTPADDAALAEVLDLEADPDAARDRLGYVIHPRSSVIIMIVLCGLLPGSVLSILSPWLLLVTTLVAVAVVGALCATVHIDRTALTVKLAGLLPVLVIPCTGIDAAVSLVVAARDHGGWGLSRRGGSASFLAASGAAVVLRQGDGGRAVVGAPDLDTADAAAAILNRRAGKPATE